MRRAAGADWAFVRDASALVVLEEVEPATIDRPLPLLDVVKLIELRNDGGPRDPRDVADVFARECRKLDVDALASDAHYQASWQPVLADAGIDWVPAPVQQEKIAETFFSLRVLLHSRRIILPRSARLKAQLADVEGRATPGGMQIASKRRKEKDGGTSHGDLISALVLAVWQLTSGAAEYRHAGVKARGADQDPRTQGARVAESFAGIPRGEFEEYAPTDP